jgi:hypothetical protein
MLSERADEQDDEVRSEALRAVAGSDDVGFIPLTTTTVKEAF